MDKNSQRVRLLGLFQDLCDREDLPKEALLRLLDPRAAGTWNEIKDCIVQAWQREQQGSGAVVSMPGFGRHVPRLVEEWIPEEGRALEPDSEVSRIITVPDLEAVGLTEIVRSWFDLNRLDPNYAIWNFWEDCVDKGLISGRGRRFKWEPWKPGRETSSEEVRRYFEARGYSGHAGAFTWWLRACGGLDGHHASIPQDYGCCRLPDGRFYAPCSGFGNGRGELILRSIDSLWPASVQFVGFCQLPDS